MQNRFLGDFTRRLCCRRARGRGGNGEKKKYRRDYSRIIPRDLLSPFHDRRRTEAEQGDDEEPGASARMTRTRKIPRREIKCFRRLGWVARPVRT